MKKYEKLKKKIATRFQPMDMEKRRKAMGQRSTLERMQHHDSQSQNG